MVVVVNIKPEELTPEDLFEVYKMFCEAHKFEANEYDERYMKKHALNDFKARLLDYRPYMGAKFFAQHFGDKTQFSGYSKPKYDKTAQRQDKRFTSLVVEHFSKRGIEACVEC